MPQLELTPVQPYLGSWPYHVDFDNIPILQLVNQIMLVNNAVDNAEDILRSAIGTQGTLANRLNQSIQANGQLRTDAVNAALHNIGYHTDGLGPDSISYVRFKAVERAKLELISDDATALTIKFDTFSVISTASITALFTNEQVDFANSDTVTWRIDGTTVYADLAFPAGAAHQHYYDRTPVHANIVTPDYQNYKVTSTATPYVDGSLRVTVNGMRLSETASIYVIGHLPTNDYILLTFTSNSTAGTFQLSTPITADDVIRIDFDATF